MIEFAYIKNSTTFVVLKPSSLGSIELYPLVARQTPLNEIQQVEWDKVIARYTLIFDRAQHCDITLVVDAEQSWFQPAAHRLVLSLLPRYNRHKPLVYMTLQFYLRHQTSFMEYCYWQACLHDFYLGLKVVRGAYLEIEKRHAECCPCFDEKWQTDLSYDSAINFILHRLDRISPFFATHNSASINKILNHSLSNKHKVRIAQLYGLGDHITYHVQERGYAVFKYLPYGPMNKSLPYLLRRIEENAIATPTYKVENSLLKIELIRRILRVR